MAHGGYILSLDSSYFSNSCYYSRNCLQKSLGCPKSQLFHWNEGQKPLSYFNYDLSSCSGIVILLMVSLLFYWKTSLNKRSYSSDLYQRLNDYFQTCQEHILNLYGFIVIYWHIEGDSTGDQQPCWCFSPRHLCCVWILGLHCCRASVLHLSIKSLIDLPLLRPPHHHRHSRQTHQDCLCLQDQLYIFWELKHFSWLIFFW